MIRELGQNVYRLQLMKLRFVTIELAPWVDVKMWNDEHGRFLLESIGFDPNVQILPGVNILSDQLGIDVVGLLGVSESGTGLKGRIGFQSSGDLPLPLRIVPEMVLKQATNLINREVSNFAVRSFERGAVKEYERFLNSEAATVGTKESP